MIKQNFELIIEITSSGDQKETLSCQYDACCRTAYEAEKNIEIIFINLLNVKSYIYLNAKLINNFWGFGTWVATGIQTLVAIKIFIYELKLIH